MCKIGRIDKAINWRILDSSHRFVTKFAASFGIIDGCCSCQLQSTPIRECIGWGSRYHPHSSPAPQIFHVVEGNEKVPQGLIEKFVDRAFEHSCHMKWLLSRNCPVEDWEWKDPCQRRRWKRVVGLALWNTILLLLKVPTIKMRLRPIPQFPVAKISVQEHATGASSLTMTTSW